MKIIENNYKSDKPMPMVKYEPYPRNMVCEICGSKLQYEESDVYVGALGCAYVDCPCCGYDNMLENNEHSIDLTVDNIEFPIHFLCTSKDAIDCCNNKEVKDAIRRAVDYFRKNKDEFAWTTEMGNLYVGVYRYDGDENYYVIVSKSYYSTYIPFEDMDYKVE